MNATPQSAAPCEWACTSRLPRWLLRLLPMAALCLIGVIDLILDVRPWPLLIVGPLDETGHLLTAAVLLVVLPLSVTRTHWPWALLGAVAIDIDHVPLYTFAPDYDVAGRPPTHSLATVLVLAFLAAVIPPARIAFGGLALGVCLHFVRDIATGPGLSLLWPFDDMAVRLPYPIYFAVMAGAAAIASWRVFGNPAGPTDASRPCP